MLDNTLVQKNGFCKDKEGCEIMLKELKEGRQRVFPVFFFFLVMFLWPVRLNCAHLGMDGMSFHASR